MPTPALTRSQCREAVKLVEGYLRKGYGRGGARSAIAAAGRDVERAGITPNGRAWIRHRIERAESLGCGPRWELEARPRPRVLTKPAKSPANAPKPERSPPAAAGRAFGPAPSPASAPGVVRVCVIPDVHLCPTHPDHSRMSWLGAWAAAEAPDWIVQLGDLGTFDSVSTHALPGSLEQGLQPRMLADFDAVARGMDLFEREAQRCKARRVVTLGNHEYRLNRFEDRNPQTQGMFADRLDEILNARGWATKPYREFQMIEGVGFIHHPTNSAGKPYGGKTSAQRAAADALFSIVHGHTHVKQAVDCPKIGGGRTRVVSPGCALPWGHVETYAKHSATGWHWGALAMTIRRGEILDEHFISMLTLQSRFGSKVRAR